MAKDYILRMIEQVAMMLAEIVASRRRGDVAEATREIADKCQQTSGLTLDLVKRSSPRAIAELLRTGGELRYLRSIMLAELLVQDAEICEESGHADDALVSYLHAFRLVYDSLEALSLEDQRVYRDKLALIAAHARKLARDLNADLREFLPAAFLSEPEAV